MKVKIDQDRCQGHGTCNMVCPQVFKHDEDGYGYVAAGMESVPECASEAVRLAEIQCPERAIIIEA